MYSNIDLFASTSIEKNQLLSDKSMNYRPLLSDTIKIKLPWAIKYL